MTASALLLPLLGGAIIGLGALTLMLFHGQIAGISGILGGLLKAPAGDRQWRSLFVGGLVAGGAMMFLLMPQGFSGGLTRSWPAVIAAGLLVGFGTRLGNGCTSGHGVCGVSRLAPRSLIATGVFMATGALAVLVVNRVFGGAL